MKSSPLLIFLMVRVAISQHNHNHHHHHPHHPHVGGVYTTLTINQTSSVQLPSHPETSAIIPATLEALTPTSTQLYETPTPVNYSVTLPLPPTTVAAIIPM